MDITAEFIVKDQKYYICQYHEYDAHVSANHDMRHQCNVVGEVIINAEKHIIIQKTHAQQNESIKDKHNALNALTRRELQIVIMVSDGMVNKVIADKLNISEWTVSTHLRRIFAKLRVDSRAEMVYKCAKVIEAYKKSPL